MWQGRVGEGKVGCTPGLLLKGCLCVCICVLCACVCVCVYLCVVCVCLCMYVCVNVCVCVDLCLCVCRLFKGFDTGTLNTCAPIYTHYMCAHMHTYRI